MTRTLTSRRTALAALSGAVARGYDRSTFRACDAARGDWRDPSRKDPS